MVSYTPVLYSLAFLFLKCKCQIIKRLESNEATYSSSPPASNNTQTTIRSKSSVDLQSPWSLGVVPYFIDSESYDNIIEDRIGSVMKHIERSSCLIFNRLETKPTQIKFMWLHFTNPKMERDCVHETKVGSTGDVIVTLGFECMLPKNIMHSILHALGFTHEVTHPHRDKYVRILWDNIQPKYRSLFMIETGNMPHRPVVEYDPQSVMHFHDRAFSINGEATIAPLIPGLMIQPSDKLSQLDKMKLKLYFSHECNQRKVDDLIDACRSILLGKTETGDIGGGNADGGNVNGGNVDGGKGKADDGSVDGGKDDGANIAGGKDDDANVDGGDVDGGNVGGNDEDNKIDPNNKGAKKERLSWLDVHTQEEIGIDEFQDAYEM